jgi:hypothetical protein
VSDVYKEMVVDFRGNAGTGLPATLLPVLEHFAPPQVRYVLFVQSA